MAIRSIDTGIYRDSGQPTLPNRTSTKGARYSQHQKTTTAAFHASEQAAIIRGHVADLAALPNEREEVIQRAKKLLAKASLNSVQRSNKAAIHLIEQTRETAVRDEDLATESRALESVRKLHNASRGAKVSSAPTPTHHRQPFADLAAPGKPGQFDAELKKAVRRQAHRRT